MWTCGAVLSFDSTRQVGRWGCGTAPTASPTPPRCRRFVWKKFPSRSNVVFEVTWLEVLQWCRLHQGLVGGGTLHGMTDHWVEMFFDGMFPETLCGMRDLERWNHRPQILLTRRLSSMANSTTESSGSFLLSSITSSFSAWPIVLEKIDISWEWNPLQTLGTRPEEIHFCIQACPNYQIPCVTPTRPRQVFPAKKNIIHYNLKFCKMVPPGQSQIWSLCPTQTRIRSQPCPVMMRCVMFKRAVSFFYTFQYLGKDWPEQVTGCKVAGVVGNFQPGGLSGAKVGTLKNFGIYLFHQLLLITCVPFPEPGGPRRTALIPWAGLMENNG